jgi:hypothetical protein
MRRFANVAIANARKINASLFAGNFAALSHNVDMAEILTNNDRQTRPAVIPNGLPRRRVSNFAKTRQSRPFCHLFEEIQSFMFNNVTFHEADLKNEFRETVKVTGIRCIPQHRKSAKL